MLDGTVNTAVCNPTRFPPLPQRQPASHANAHMMIPLRHAPVRPSVRLPRNINITNDNNAETDRGNKIA